MIWFVSIRAAFYLYICMHTVRGAAACLPICLSVSSGCMYVYCIHIYIYIYVLSIYCLDNTLFACLAICRIPGQIFSSEPQEVPGTPYSGSNPVAQVSTCFLLEGPQVIRMGLWGTLKLHLVTLGCGSFLGYHLPFVLKGDQKEHPQIFGGSSKNKNEPPADEMVTIWPLGGGQRPTVCKSSFLTS